MSGVVYTSASSYLSNDEKNEAMAYGNYTEYNSSWGLPPFHNNLSGAIQQTARTRSTGDINTGSSGNEKIYRGTCIQHWASNDVYNYFINTGAIPTKISGGQLITADSVNTLKNLLNTLIRGWTQGGGIQTYTNGKSFSSSNEKINATNIDKDMSPNNLIKTDVWDDILSRLQIFDTIKDITKSPSQDIDTPSSDITITRSNYNRLIDSLIIISKACKCNSDCACNMVCVCNSDCGCNY